MPGPYVNGSVSQPSKLRRTPSNRAAPRSDMSKISRWLRAIGLKLGFLSSPAATSAPDVVPPQPFDLPEADAQFDAEHEVPKTARFLDDPQTDIEIDFRGGDWDKFKLGFEGAARKMSVEDRQTLRRHWRRNPGAPTITVENERILHEQQLQGGAAAIGSNVDGRGLAFRFAGLAMDEMPDILVETLIAHELAHVVQNLLVFEKRLHGEEKAAFDSLTPDCEDIDKITEAEKRAYAAKITQWQEEYTDRRTLKWDETLDCAKLRRWLDDYLKRNPELLKKP